MADGLRADGVYEFGDFRLIAAQRRLTVRSDGRAIELTPKALDTLHFLVQHRGELLDKSTLIAAVWPNVVVEENNLNQVVSALRRALGDGSDFARDLGLIDYWREWGPPEGCELKGEHLLFL